MLLVENTLPFYCSCKQGVLTKMEEQLSTLHQELSLKDIKIEKLTSALSEVSSKVAKSEKTTDINSRRIGTNVYNAL